MQEAPNPWEELKKAILNAQKDLTWVYTDLEGQKSSGNGWVTAKCPFHEDNDPSFAYEKKTGNWICHAGCGKGSVFDFRGRVDGTTFKTTLQTMGDELGIDGPQGDSESKTTYDYQDGGGNLLFQVVRSPGKIFWVRRPNGSGNWIKNLEGVQRVLYRLPELISRPDEIVFIVEGEKDADRLHDLGLLATTNFGGAEKWSPHYTEALSGRDIVILPDNDKIGRSHTAQVVQSLGGKAKSVRVVELPDLPEKADVSDWLDAGGDFDQLEKLVEATNPIPEGETPNLESGLPAIQTHDRHLRDIYDEAWGAVLAGNDPPRVFNAAGHLARLKDMGHGPQIDFLNKEGATGLLARSADWIRTKGDKKLIVKPVKEVADELVTTPHAKLPKLDAVIHTPVYDEKWRLILEPGYHPDARLWLHLEAGATPYSVPDSPTEDDVQAALSLIQDDLLVDFPFAADSDLAHTIAALVLPFARRMFTGPTPIHLIEAPVPGTGKSLLAELIAIIALGVIPGVTTLTKNEEETRKKLTAILSRGTSVIAIDNQEGGMNSSQVAAAITAEYWEDRILGKTQMVRYPNQALWMISGNNPNLSMEIARRCIRIRLDTGEEHPWQGRTFKHPDIREWTRNHRHELVQAVLTLIRHWVVSGCPTFDQTLGSFENWSRVIGGMIQHFGMPGFLEDAEEFYETADPESGEWSALVDTWWGAYRDTPKPARDLLQLAKDNDMVGFAYSGNTDRAQLTRFGMKLTGLRDRRFGDHRVIIGKDTHKKVKVFRLVVVEKGLFS